MQNEPKCEDCRFFFPLKDFNKGNLILKNVCCMLPITDGERDAYALVTFGNDKCEMFEERNR